MADLTLANFNMLYIRTVDDVEQEIHVPLGPLYLVSVLRRAGIDVDFRDYQLAARGMENPFGVEAIGRFLEGSARIVGVSCMANLLPFVILGLERFKQASPSSIVVLGGVGPWAIERRIMERFPWIDIVAMGEAEGFIVNLVETLGRGGDLAGVPGVLYRKGGEILGNPPPPRIENLDDLPLPAFDAIPLGEYEGYGVISSRGCPYPCTFCSVMPIWGRRATYRGTGAIIDEMETLRREAGADLFLFQDEFFVSSKRRVLEFCNELRRRNLRVNWKAFGRVDLTDEETMEAMAAAGCIEIRYGIESGSNEVLRKVRKGFTAEKSIEVVSRAVGILPRVDTFFIWGFPFETMEDFRMSLFRMVSFRTLGARILPSLLCLLPQTEIFRQIREDGLKLDFCEDLFPEYMVTGHEIFRTSGTSIDEKHRYIYDLIRANPDLFPGFFHVDLLGNIRPKLALMREFGFYPDLEEKPKAKTESCGAHSPKVDPRIRNAATSLDRRPHDR
jgi:anaerobic magnesium-protoporphyrin IX monomethyl ester cyclase